MQEAKVKIEAMRDDCKMLMKKIEEDFGGVEILVVDPLYPVDPPVWTGQERVIQFSRKIRMSEDEQEDDQLWQSWMPRSPLWSEVLTKLGRYKDFDKVRNVTCKIGNEVYSGSEIR